MATTTSPKTPATKSANKNTKAKEPTTNQQISALLDDLEAESDQRMKKQIRAKLRRLGHYGASRTPAKQVSKVEAAKFTARKPDATDDQGE